MSVKNAFLLFLSGLCGCAHIPEGVEAVRGLEPERYLGSWFEIARLENRFERGLVNVSAEYSMNGDGSIRVVNRGFDPERNLWKEAVGRAYFVEGPDLGRLRVSFFRPFYGSYNIIELDKQNYSHAMVCGDTRDYLWILARTRTLPDEVINSLVLKAGTLGFSTNSLLRVRQNTGNKE